MALDVDALSFSRKRMLILGIYRSYSTIYTILRTRVTDCGSAFVIFIYPLKFTGGRVGVVRWSFFRHHDLSIVSAVASYTYMTKGCLRSCHGLGCNANPSKPSIR